MGGAPHVSVIVPTRNRPHFATQAIASALAQKDVSVEVIAVDDASTDDTPSVLGTIPDPRLRVVRRAEPHRAAARNTGLREARGGWVAFLDDDDLWSPVKLRRQLDAALAADAGFAYTGGLVVDAELRPLHVLRMPAPETVYTELLQLNVIPAGASNVLARTGLVRSLGGFDERFWHLSDWDLWIRLAAASRATAVDELLLAYRLHASGHGSVRGKHLEELDLLESKHRSLLAEAGVTLNREAVASWMEKRARQADDQRVGRVRRLVRSTLRSPSRTGELPRPAWLRPS
jgi:glycosyltransferase involved in cell wall biosynthesis